MRRLFTFLILAGIVAFAVAWIANRQGELIYVIDGYEVTTSAGMAIGLALLFAALVMVLTRVVATILSGPEAFGRWSSLRRLRRGQDALSRGLVAVAAGDAAEARRQAKKARGVLGGSPLGLLLTAQTAHLEGNDQAQGTAYRAMLEHPETEFLGLRGLFMEAMRRDDHEEAVRLAARAHTLKPRAAWAANALFDLKSARGEWSDAKAVLESAQRAKLIEPGVAKRRRAVLLAAEALEAEHDNRDHALDLAQKALDLSPSLAPAAALVARQLAAEKRVWRAQDVVEAAWTQAPHPDLAAAYAAIRPDETPEERAERMIGLAHLKRDHFESRMLEAEQDVNLGKWSEARRVLAPLSRGFASVRVCTLMAEIEQGDRHDASAAHAWLERAVRAPRDAEWRCSSCGWTSTDWQAVCGHCSAFDTLSWSAPTTGRLEAYSAMPFDDDLQFDEDVLDVDVQSQGDVVHNEPEPPQPSDSDDEESFVTLPRAPDDPGPDGEDFDAGPPFKGGLAQ